MFTNNDNFRILEDKKIPYYAIELTNEQAKEIEHKKIDIYKTDGKTIFDVKDKDGNLTDKKMMFILFKE